MRRLLPLVAVLVLGGCDAGNRADPGSDNTLTSPTLVISTPYEGQQVVPTASDGTVQVLFDVQGASFGRTAGSKVRYRLQRAVEHPEGKPSVWVNLVVQDPKTGVLAADLRMKADPETGAKSFEATETAWVVVSDPQHAVNLGKLAPMTSRDSAYPYVLTAEVIDKDGKPWTRVEEGQGTVNARARVVRTFTVHKSW